jgi:hypothetical protein
MLERGLPWQFYYTILFRMCSVQTAHLLFSWQFYYTIVFRMCSVQKEHLLFRLKILFLASLCASRKIPWPFLAVAT